MEKSLREFCLKERVPALWNASLSDYTSFHIGGAADAFLLPETEAAFVKLLAFLNASGRAFRVIGNGTNLLFSDRGVRGVIVSTRHMRGVTVRGRCARASAGLPLNVLCRALAEASLGGMECLYGIPGTVGGALVMNAGAYGAAISDTLSYVSLYDREERAVISLPKKELSFSYRKSLLQRERRYTVLSAEFSLESKNSEAIRDEMKRVLSRRMETQPTTLPSAGSAFLRPERGYAAEWIEQAGLLGARVGGAAVSVKHAGFIVNLGGATAEDVRTLIAQIQNEVERRFGVLLVPEIEYIDEEITV